MKCYYQNVRGLRSKTHTIYNSIAENDYDLICLSETWLAPDILDSEIVNYKYIVYRNDRNFDLTGATRGGGVLISVNSLFHTSLLDLDFILALIPSINLVGIKLIISRVTYYIINVYIPPNSPLDVYDSLFEAICSLQYLLNGDSNVLILGDFNIPDYIKLIQLGSNNSKLLCSLTNFMNYLGFVQCNKILNVSNRVLDLVICRSDISVQESHSPLVSVDLYHPPLEFSLNLMSGFSKFKNNKQVTFNFRKSNFPQLYDGLLQTDWSFLERYSNVDLACHDFYDKINGLFAESVPKTVSKRASYPPWFTVEIIRQLREKAQLLRRAKSTGEEQALASYKILRNKLKKDITASHSDYIRRAESDLSQNPSKFWACVNNVRNSSSIPNSMCFENNELNNPQQIVDAFASFFQSAFISSSNFSPAGYINNCNMPTLSVPIITEETVLKCLKKCKPKMTTGPDGIPSFLLRDCAIIFAKPLTILFNMSLKALCFPNAWKNAKLCPVFKKGDKSNVANYRPIAIICNFSKVFEMVIYEIIYAHVKPQIVDPQHGFVRGRSTTSNLTCITQFIATALNDCSQVDVIYTDFSRAFDRLDHGVLLRKLSSVGLTDGFVWFLKSYLTERRLKVQYHGFWSVEVIPSSGVPQGSVLGPLLFIIFINDICLNIESEILLYADDCKLFRRINALGDCSSLQSDIDELSEWCLKNLLPLNIEKCNIVTYTKKKLPTEYQYKINLTILKRNSEYRDLGVIFDSKLTFIPHIDSTVSNCFKILGFIVRNSGWFSEIGTLKLLFGALVRSKLEYASVVWDPGYDVRIGSLESVQRRFLKYLSFKYDGSYPDRGIEQETLLARFDVKPLKSRRTCLGILFLQKIINGRIDCPYLLSNINLHVPRLPVRNVNTFYLPLPQNNVMLFSPLYSICSNYSVVQNAIDIFNSKPNDIKRILL